jgi:hypothetical protein
MTVAILGIGVAGRSRYHRDHRNGVIARQALSLSPV